MCPCESQQMRELRTEGVVLVEINNLYPELLTIDELILRLEDPQGEISSTRIKDAINALERSGVVRRNGQVVEPTHAARRVLEVAFL